MDTLVAMPCLNEARRAVPAIASLLADPASARCQFLLLDGGSTDGTRDRVAEAFGARVEIVDNPQRLQAHALNLAARIASKRGLRRLVRADLHALYEVDFLTRLSATLDETGAQSVVVPMHTQGGNPVQDAAALLYSSWLGNGGSPHRTGAYRGWVEHGHHALFDLNAFLAAGGYDPEFVANEDAEFDLRLRAGGGRIFLENRAAIRYIPRASFAATFRQFFRNGRYRIWTAVKHRERLGKRQLLPIAIGPVLVLSLLLSLVTAWALLVPLGYAMLVLALVWKARDKAPVRASPRLIVSAAALAVVTHLGFSAGAHYGAFELLVRAPALRRKLQSRHHPDLREV